MDAYSAAPSLLIEHSLISPERASPTLAQRSPLRERLTCISWLRHNIKRYSPTGFMNTVGWRLRGHLSPLRRHTHRNTPQRFTPIILFYRWRRNKRISI